MARGTVLFAAGVVAALALLEPAFAQHKIGLLRPGVPEMGFVAAGEFKYYVINGGRGRDLMFEVTPTDAGDPNLYINCDHVPSVTDNKWSSADPGADSLLIAGSDPNYCKSGGGMFYVGITTDKGNTTFVVSGNIDPEHVPILLPEGLPLAGTTQGGDYIQFLFALPMIGRSVTVSLTPTAGDPDLYISCTPGPTNANYTWSSQTSSVDVVHIQGSDAHFCPARRFYISVFGFRGEAKFLVTAHSGQNAPQQLIEGQPDSGDAIEGTYAYYSFKNDDKGVDVFLDLTPLGQGDPDMYVNCATDGRPTRGDHRWSSVQPGLGLEHLAFSSVGEQHCPVGVAYVIGILSSGNTAATFSLLATTDQHQFPVHLMPGVPQAGQASEGQPRLFMVDLTNATSKTQTLTFTGTIHAGTMQMFASSHGATPTKQSHQWASGFTVPGSPTITLAVHEYDPNFLGTPVIVAVYGSGVGGNPAVFTLTATVKNG